MSDMKKTCIFMAVILFAAAGLYAEGQGEDPLATYRNQVSLSGTLQFADGFPVISVDGRSYRLFAPHLMHQAYTLKPGLALTVEGYLVQQGPWTRGGDISGRPAGAESIFVQKITVDGKTFNIYSGRPEPGYGFGSGKGYRDGRHKGFCGNYWDGDRRGDGPGRDERGRRYHR
jgi:hypothetical protein